MYSFRVRRNKIRRVSRVKSEKNSTCWHAEVRTPKPTPKICDKPLWWPEGDWTRRYVYVCTTLPHLRRQFGDLRDVLERLSVPPRLPLLGLEHLAVRHVDRVPPQHLLEHRKAFVEPLRQQHLPVGNDGKKNNTHTTVSDDGAVRIQQHSVHSVHVLLFSFFRGQNNKITRENWIHQPGVRATIFKKKKKVHIYLLDQVDGRLAYSTLSSPNSTARRNFIPRHARKSQHWLLSLDSIHNLSETKTFGSRSNLALTLKSTPHTWQRGGGGFLRYIYIFIRPTGMILTAIHWRQNNPRDKGLVSGT